MTTLRAESAYKGEGFCAAGSVQDLQQAYERIIFELVWGVAGRTGFPLTLMAWITSLRLRIETPHAGRHSQGDCAVAVA